MKKLLFVILLLISSISFSQTDSEYPKRVVTEDGQELMIMTMEQGREIITDLKKYEISDSLLNYYIERDSLNGVTITFKQETIDALNKKVKNLENVNFNNKTIIENKDKQISMLNKEIARLEDEIGKQKTYKWIAIGGGVGGIILTAVIMNATK